MRKKVLSLCMALVLCLGLLPATALAAEEIKLFIGGQQITESGCYANQNGTWTKVGSAEPASGQFYYDAATFTLTLNKAVITNNQTVNVAEGYTYDGSVIAFSQTADVSLKIVVSQGTSTITGKGGIRVESTTGNASLSIKGSGSLDVEPKGSNSGITLCSSKNTNLDIDGADVTASSPAQYGVYLISSTDASSTSTITVNNGSLTTGGNGNVGIYYYWSGTSNAGTPSLTVSGNAVVDTRNSQIMAQNKETVVQVGAGSDGNGGIVFDGKSGTVYGDVTLEDDLEIASGETLTIPDDSSLNSNGKLTNNGKIIVDNGGKLEGTINGNQPPKITTERLNDGTVNTKYNQTLVASGDATIIWSSSDLPNWLTLNSDGTISGTPTAAGASTFTVTATNDNGSDSKALTLTINPAPILVTGVTLNKSELALYTGGSATLTATVQPEDATNKAVNWSSSDEAVATVDTNGKVTAVGEGNTTITVTTVDGNHTATCTVTVTASPEPEPEPTPPPYIPPSKPNWTSVARKLANAQPGDTVTVKMNGETEVPGEVWETIAGRDVTVILDMGGNVSWTVDGNDVPTATHFADMDFGVDRNTTGIDVDVINAITGQVSSVQITLAHDGEFGFTLTLTAPLGRENAGYWVNLYHYDENAKTLNYETSGEIQKDGTASLKMTHASQYAIVIDDKSHVLPFTDLGEGQWYESAVRYAYTHDIMEGMNETTFSPNTSLTRAEAVQVLYNLEGRPAVSGNAAFPDLVEKWYKPAIAWAEQTGVVDGYEDGTFRPENAVTRQEFAQMLYNYAKYKGYDLTAQGDLSQFPDSGSVADWAEAAMSWANGNKLINGHDDGTIDAAGTATRAQAASILMRFDQNLVEK